VLFALCPPAERSSATTAPAAASAGSLLAHRHLVLGAIGIFLYVGGEVSIGSFLINFLGEPADRRPGAGGGATTSACTGAARWSAASSALP
jgi:fucose permease